MFQYVLFASLVVIGQCRPSLIDTEGFSGGGLSGGYGGGWQGALNFAGEGGHDFEGASSSYGGLNLQGHQAQQGGGGGGGGGDFHHGISVVGIGGEQKSTVFDLTSHAGAGHKGAFGGSFVASSKYGGGGSHSGGGGGAGYGVSEDYSNAGAEYSDVLGASESIGHSGGGGGGGHQSYEALPAWALGVGGGHEGLSAYHSDGAGLGYH